MLGGETLVQRYERTISGLEEIEQAAYTVVTKWKSALDKAKMTDRKPVQLTQPIDAHSTLMTRDGLYGGSTLAICLHHKARDDDDIEYADKMSLYSLSVNITRSL
jgi:hypothetical protein